MERGPGTRGSRGARPRSQRPRPSRPAKPRISSVGGTRSPNVRVTSKSGGKRTMPSVPKVKPPQ